jgi:hypothetical protein
MPSIMRARDPAKAVLMLDLTLEFFEDGWLALASRCAANPGNGRSSDISQNIKGDVTSPWAYNFTVVT